jgi:hypothetical protein
MKEKFHDFCTSPNIMKVIMSTMMSTGHVARMGEKKNSWRVFVERFVKIRQFAKRKKIIQMQLKEFGKDVGWSGFSWLNKGTSGGVW